MAWNPNDWFNTYNYFDFDYEERPGTDAIRVRVYFKDGMSSLMWRQILIRLTKM